jgi:hypothetical protein
MELLGERPIWSMSGAEMLTALDELQVDLTRRQVRRLELLAALDTNGYATEIGARDTVQLVSIRHRLDSTDVRRDLQLATALPKYPAVQAALTDGVRATPESPTTTDAPEQTADGEQADGTAGAEQSDRGASTAGGALGFVLHPGQAAAIVSALEKVPATATVSVEDLQVAEGEMVKAAEFLPPGELRTLGKEVRDRLDPDGPDPTDDDAQSREQLWLKNADQGVKFGGYLAAENAELFQTLIFAGAKPHKTPDGQRDPRGRGKRQADALTAVLHTAAGTGTAVPGHGDIKPHITVTIDLDDLKGSAGTGDLVHGDSLSAAAVRRLACDAGIIPLVLGSNSEPLDVGTEERFVTRAIRRALNARDTGCIICGAPPAMCEAHHIIHWADGGPTSLDNLVLLCKREHIDTHKGHWTINMVNGLPRVTRPAWADPSPPSRARTRAEPPPPSSQPHQTKDTAAASRAEPGQAVVPSPRSGTGRAVVLPPQPRSGDATAPSLRPEPGCTGSSPAARLGDGSSARVRNGPRRSPSHRTRNA